MVTTEQRTVEATPEEVRRRVDRLLTEFGEADDKTFYGAQFDLGLARIDFPPGHGGLGGEPKLQEIVDTALEPIGRRGNWMRNAIGIGMCGPTIAARGTEEQKSRFLRPIFTAEEVWCQLFSEPGAGSDVAGLSTRAERDGDQWVINGQKVWTSGAQNSKWGLLLARTDPDAPKHKGLTMFIVDMHGPGVEIRPLRQMSGGAHFNEVYFTDARTPDDLRVGEPGQGWSVANATLMNERVSIGGNVAPRGGGAIGRAVEVWKARADHEPVLRERLAGLWIEAEVLRLGNMRAQSLRQAGVPGPQGSLLKLGDAELGQRIVNFIVDLLGAHGMLSPGYEVGRDRDIERNDPIIAFLSSQATTIAGGTSQIMRNIIGERVLGLPREPGLDPNTPWSQIPRNT